MIDIDIVTLEDGIEYDVIDAISNKGNNYLVLQSHNNENDICLRKILTENNTEYMVKLDNENEFKEIMELFYKKHKGERKNEE